VSDPAGAAGQTCWTSRAETPILLAIIMWVTLNQFLGDAKPISQADIGFFKNRSGQDRNAVAG